MTLQNWSTAVELILKLSPLYLKLETYNIRKAGEVRPRRWRVYEGLSVLWFTSCFHFEAIAQLVIETIKYSLCTLLLRQRERLRGVLVLSMGEEHVTSLHPFQNMNGT